MKSDGALCECCLVVVEGITADEFPGLTYVGGLFFSGVSSAAGGGSPADVSEWQQYQLQSSLKTSQDYLACVTKVRLQRASSENEVTLWRA
jgi:hypothetical protein